MTRQPYPQNVKPEVVLEQRLENLKLARHLFDIGAISAEVYAENKAKYIRVLNYYKGQGIDVRLYWEAYRHLFEK